MSRRSGEFVRRLDALAAVVAFTDEALGDVALATERRYIVDFAIEEIFSNMVKYAPEGAPTIRIDIESAAQGVAVSLIDSGVEAFDPVNAPDACVDLPLDERVPGGLGLHLVRRLVDDLRYERVPEQRQNRIHFRVATTVPGHVRG
jgi:serine/threonine-protein kinase RsbW